MMRCSRGRGRRSRRRRGGWPGRRRPGWEHAALEEELAGPGPGDRSGGCCRITWTRGRRREPRLARGDRARTGSARTRAERGACPGAGQRVRAGDGDPDRLPGARRAPNVHPADAELGLPAGQAFARAGGDGGGGGGARVAGAGVRAGQGPDRVQAGDPAGAAAGPGGGGDFGGLLCAPGPAPVAGPGEVLVLSCDAKGIRMRPGQLRPAAGAGRPQAVPKQDGRLSQGEVRTRKRMAAAGAVFAITPVPRTAADILRRPATPPGRARPEPRRKWLTASVTADDRRGRGRGVRRGGPPRPGPPAALDRAGRREQGPDRPDQGTGRRPRHHRHRSSAT